MAEQEVKSSDTISVLYVDDEEGLLELASLFIAGKEGIKVDTAISAADGIDMMSKKRYDVLISDYQMPEMDGIQFLKFVRSSGDRIPFIIFTGKGREEVVIEALNAGADLYIQKGGNPRAQYAELVNMIKQLTIKKRMEKALIINEFRFKTVLEGSPTLIYSVDKDGIIIDANEAFKNTLNMERDRLVGKNYFQFKKFHPNGVQEDDFVKLALKGQVAQNERQFTINNKLHHFYSVAQPILGPDGIVDGAMVFAQDRTDLYNASSALADMELDFQILFDESIIGLFIADSDGKIQKANDTLLKMFGISESIKTVTTDLNFLKFLPLKEKEITSIKEGHTFRSEELIDFSELSQILPFPISKKGKMWLEITISSRFTNKGNEKIFDGFFFHVIDITESKLLMDEILTSKQNMEITLSSIGDGVISTDINGRIVLMNQVAQEITGCSIQKALGKKLEEVFIIIQKKSGKGASDIFQQVMAQKEILQMGNDTVLTSHTGKEYQISDSAAPIWDNEKQISGMVMVFRDVTERYQFFQQLQESEKKYRDLFENIPLGYAHHRIILDDAGKPVDYLYLNVNQRFEDLTGMQIKDCIGNTIKTIFPDLEDFWIEKYGMVALTGESAILESYSRTLDRYYRVYAYCPNPGEFVTIFDETTDKVSLTRWLEESEENLRVTLASIGDAVISTDLGGNVVLMNPVAEKLTGWRQLEAEGRHLNEIFRIHNAHSGKIVSSPIEEVIKTGSIVGLANHTVLVSKGGEEYQIADSASPIRDGNGMVQGVVLVFRDVSMEYHLRELLEESQKELSAMFNNLPIGCAVLTGLRDDEGTLRDLVYVTANRAYRELTKISDEDIIGNTFTRVMPRTDPNIYDIIVDVLNGGPSRVVDDYHREHGGVFRLNVYAQGKDKVAVSLEDFTQKNILENHLRESEGKFRLLFQNLPFAYVLYDVRLEGGRQNYYLEDMNAFFENITGVQISQAKGKELRDVFPELEQQWVDFYDDVYSSDTPGIMEGFNKDTGENFILHAYVPQKGRLVALFDVVSHGKRMEAVIHKTEERYRSVFENAGTAMFVIASDGNIIMSNSQFQGFCPSGKIPENIRDIIQKLDDKTAKELKDFLSGSIPDGQLLHRMEVVMPCQEGSRNLLFSRVKLSLEDQTIISVVDLTDQIKLTNAVEMANKKLTLLSSITRHDILNMIMVMKGYLDLMQESGECNHHQSSRDKLHQTLERIEKLIRFTAEYEEIGLYSPNWRKVVDCIESDMELPIHVAPGLELYEVFADRMLSKVFHNLYQNTVKYGHGATAINVDFQEQDNTLKIFWKDDGEGVMEERKERIFNRGFGNGTGLGLFLARNILEITNVSIKEIGIPGEGATFEISVPFSCYRLSN